MNPAQIYIAIAIAVLALIALLVFVVRKTQRGKSLTPLAGLAFGFILAGLFFGGDNRLIWYSLLGVGVLLAVFDIVRKMKGT
jgi:hypothetical protein